MIKMFASDFYETVSIINKSVIEFPSYTFMAYLAEAILKVTGNYFNNIPLIEKGLYKLKIYFVPNFIIGLTKKRIYFIEN